MTNRFEFWNDHIYAHKNVVQIAAVRVDRKNEVLHAPLFRVFLFENSFVGAKINHEACMIEENTVITLSPDDRLNFDTSLPSGLCIAFHNAFFCTKVNRSEVFCDGVVFNRLLGLPALQFDYATFNRLCDRTQAIAEEIDTNSALRDELLVAELRLLLVQIANQKLMSIQKNGAKSVVAVSKITLGFQDLVESHYLKQKSVGFYVEKLNTTSMTLNRHLREELGRSASEIISERVAVEARTMLRSGTLSVKEIAAELGFNDAMYFSRFFKRHFGKSPKQYFLEPQPNAAVSALV